PAQRETQKCRVSFTRGPRSAIKTSLETVLVPPARAVPYETMNESLAKHYLDDAIASFRTYKKLAEKALDQLKDEEYFVTLDAESNSIAVIMKHLAGNMFSRWTDFLTSDGEKP